MANEGASYDFILGRLPECPNQIFVDAWTEWGIGGVCGTDYFRASWPELSAIGTQNVAEKELLACLVALKVFSSALRGRLVTM